ncbi:MAG: protein translocase subunit SecD [Bacteroides sp.]|nr:protein translocase subunit SecD [Bacteroides sp.]MCM1413033.1 protein translocase subunit SecD [Bacteroides sp.]MCM1471739.1 protein translocase subunit SecD [Bacteroides sp.]
MQKGKLGSVVAGILAIFLVLICFFYLSFTYVSNHHEDKAVAYAMTKSGDKNQSSQKYRDAYKFYFDSIANKPVWLGYTQKEAQKLSIGLGLDLKGGMNVTLQLSISDILKSIAGENANATLDRVIANTDSVVAQTKSNDYVGTFVAESQKINPKMDLAVMFREVIKAGANQGEIETTLKQEVKDRVNSSANVLRQRIDQFGVVAPNIQELEKDGQILLELPGVTDHERMEELLKASANLEFFTEQPVENYMSELRAFDSELKQRDGKGFFEHFTDYYPQGMVVGRATKAEMAVIDSLLQEAQNDRKFYDLRFAWGVKPTADPRGDLFELYSMKTDGGEAILSGDVVKEAHMDFDKQAGGTYVSMDMNTEAANRWASITGQNVGKRIAIVLDNRVYSAPTVNDKISGGRSQITGNFTPDEGKDLANVLKSGKMAGEINIISSTKIGPSLGQQAIHDGMWSFVIALILLMIFMCAFYGIIPGLIANLGLIFNIFFTFGILASFQAVLTLSGIAGIVLALGMAVDANVLIFERTKEELRAGKNLRNAVADGYSNAFSAIFDSNLTSIITGVILLMFGTGPIKGFATTLIIGIVCSFFTAVYLTRLVFIAFDNTKAFRRLTFSTTLSKKMFTNTHIDFLGKRKVSFGVVIALVVVFIGSLCLRGLSSGIDFSGGRNYVIQFNQAVSTTDIADQLASSFDGNKPTVINIDDPTKIRVSTNYMIDEEKANVDSIITARMYAAFQNIKGNDGKSLIAGMTADQFAASDESTGIISSQKVGPTVANDMRTDAYIAVGLSLLAMFLYILIRFRNIAFSFGALAAVAFTAFSIVGFYSIFYGAFPFAMEIDQSFIAAILTVIGYQINDTVVVFDRVRENVNLFPKQDFGVTINQSLNSTLSRTVMTSASTLLVLLCIFILGGDAIRSFTFAMIFGVVIGTCASIFVAAPTAYLINRRNIKKAA